MTLTWTRHSEREWGADLGPTDWWKIYWTPERMKHKFTLVGPYGMRDLRRDTMEECQDLAERMRDALLTNDHTTSQPPRPAYESWRNELVRRLEDEDFLKEAQEWIETPGEFTPEFQTGWRMGAQTAVGHALAAIRDLSVDCEHVRVRHEVTSSPGLIKGEDVKNDYCPLCGADLR